MPHQTVDEVIEDLQTAINAGVNQITLYPMFTFPFSTAGKYLKISSINAPSFFTRWAMHHAIHDVCINNGFERTTVWSFKRSYIPSYSSVSRENFLGIGAGAISHLSGLFYLNTFVVKVYIATCLNHQLPIALKMNFSDKMTHYHWLYWQFYNTFIPKQGLAEKFGIRNLKINILFKVLKTLGFCQETDSNYELTTSGAFWFYLMQKKFVLAPMSTVWTTAMKDPWPQEIHL
jgi:oxygen-independent coproporphyrinogen-3 oxidase